MNYLKTFLPYLFGNKKGKSLDIPLPDQELWSVLSFEEKLVFHTLKNSINQYIESFDLKSLSRKDIFHLFNFLDFLKIELKNKITTLFNEEFNLYIQSLNTRSLLPFQVQELLDFKNQKLSLFVLLSSDRLKPGVAIVRSPEGHFMKNEDQNIWSIPILGLSRRGLPFHHSNGHTPTGVFTLDSVMPLANNNLEFGQFRRLIINFISASPNELTLKNLLPDKHHGLNWWKPSILAREMGRSLLRIHGTGRINYNPFSSYFPFVPTSGCLATREPAISVIHKSQDQRLLLDTLMRAMNLPLSDENESKIHGLLYVIHLDDKLTTLRLLLE